MKNIIWVLVACIVLIGCSDREKATLERNKALVRWGRSLQPTDGWSSRSSGSSALAGESWQSCG